MKIEEWITEGCGRRGATFNLGIVFLHDFVNGRIVFAVGPTWEFAYSSLLKQIEADLSLLNKEESNN